MTHLIGITGRAGVGKDTAADHLVHAHGFARYSLADPIRHGLVAMLHGIGLTPAHFSVRECKEQPLSLLGKSPRQLAQTLGTEWGRQLVHPDLWLLLAEQVIADVTDNGGRGIVIPDVRFDNEADLIRRHHGTLIHIQRDSATAVAAHSSEAGVSDHLIHLRILNQEGAPEIMHQHLDDLVHWLSQEANTHA